MSSNSTWNMGVDMIPKYDNSFSLGDENHRWLINGQPLGDICDKNVDSSVTSGSTSTNVPTTQAVASFVDEYVSVSGTKLVIGGSENGGST